MLRIISQVSKDINKLKLINRYSIYEVFMHDWFIQHQLKQKVKIHNRHQYESYCYQVAFDIFKERKV